MKQSNHTTFLTLVVLTLFSCRSQITHWDIYGNGFQTFKVLSVTPPSNQCFEKEAEHNLAKNQKPFQINPADTLNSISSLRILDNVSQKSINPVFSNNISPDLKSKKSDSSQNSRQHYAAKDPMNISLLASYNMLMDVGLVIMLLSSLYLGFIGLLVKGNTVGMEFFLPLLFGFLFLGLGFILWLIGLLHFKYTQKQKLKKKSAK